MAKAEAIEARRGFFEPYLKGTAFYTRLGIFIFGVLWSLFGAVGFYSFVMQGSWFRDFSTMKLLGDQLTAGKLVSALVWLGGCTLSWWVVNYPKWVDFVIETEGEMKKVSWPSRDDLIRSTIIVLVIVVAFSMYMFGIDQAILWLLNRLM